MGDSDLAALKDRLMEFDDPIAEVRKMIFLTKEDAIAAGKIAIDVYHEKKDGRSNTGS